MSAFNPDTVGSPHFIAATGPADLWGEVREDVSDAFIFKDLTSDHSDRALCLLVGRADISTIANHFPQDRSVISRHLHMMGEAGLLAVEKETRHRFYNINGEKLLREFETIVTNLRACIHECCPPK